MNNSDIPTYTQLLLASLDIPSELFPDIEIPPEDAEFYRNSLIEMARECDIFDLDVDLTKLSNEELKSGISQWMDCMRIARYLGIV